MWWDDNIPSTERKCQRWRASRRAHAPAGARFSGREMASGRRLQVAEGELKEGAGCFRTGRTGPERLSWRDRDEPSGRAGTGNPYSQRSEVQP